MAILPCGVSVVIVRAVRVPALCRGNGAQAARRMAQLPAPEAEHRRQVYSTNPLERLNKELKRRSAVVGIFPNRAAVLRLLGAILAEQNDEWLVGRRYFSEASMRKLTRAADENAAALEAPAA